MGVKVPGDPARTLTIRCANKMDKENSEIAAEIKQKSVIDMALTFTAMIRLFEKRSKPKISKKLYDEFQKLYTIKGLDDFYAFHDRFRKWFTSNVHLQWSQKA